MGKNLFLIRGNICAERVRLGRALQKPPMTQDDLAPMTLEAYFEEIDSVRDRYETLLNEGRITEERYEAIEETLSALYDWGDQAAEYAEVEG